MKPLIRNLGVDSRMLSAIVNIASFNKLGWEILGINLTKEFVPFEKDNQALLSKSDTKINPFRLLALILEMIDWKKLKAQFTKKTVSSEQLKLTKSDYLTRLLEIGIKLDGEEHFKYSQDSEVHSLLKLMHSVLVNDI